MARAYSYIRFSTPEQARGDSLRRQTDLSEKFAAENGLELDTTLNLTDLGVSAYKGKNKTEGNLGSFLKMVKDGLIEKGSYLLVESLDRLSREEARRSYRLFDEILELGIYVVTLSDGKVYDPNNFDQMDMIMSILIMSRAHEESATKSKRVKAAWKNKKNNAETKIVTKWCPKWLSVDEDRTEFTVIEERAEVVRSIFEWASDGYGYRKIVNLLDKNNIQPWSYLHIENSKTPSSWHISYIKKILVNRAALGDYNTKIDNDGVTEDVVIENYYPAVVSEELYYKAQTARNTVVKSGRKGESFTNLFQGVTYCGYDCSNKNQSMSISNKGIRRYKKADGTIKEYPNQVYMQCGRDKNGTRCKKELRKLWYYPEFEETFLTYIHDIDISILFPAVSPKKDKLISLNSELNLLEGQIVHDDKQIDKIADAMLVNEKIPQALIKKMNKLEEEKAEKLGRIEELKAELSLIESESDDVGERHSQMIELIDKMKSLNGAELYDLRQRLNKLLQRLVRIKVYSAGMNPNTEKQSKFRKQLQNQTITKRFDVEYLETGEHRAVMINKAGDVIRNIKTDENGSTDFDNRPDYEIEEEELKNPE